MTVGLMEIRNYEREKQPLFPVDISLPAALATACKIRWPSNTAKHCAREFDLTLDAARNVVTGKCSMRPLGDILKHKRGGLDFVVPAIEAAANDTLSNAIQRAKERNASEQERIAANDASLDQMARNLPALLGLGGQRRPVVADEPKLITPEPPSRRVSQRN